MIAAGPGFPRELKALIRVRQAISRAQREQGPAGWWIKHSLLTGVAVLFVLGAFIGGWGISGDAHLDRDKAATLFLFAPITAAGFLLFIQMGDRPGAHPIGELRGYLPISRRRSALLRLAEDTLTPGTVFIFAYGWASWVGMLVAGEHWLNAGGWVCVALLPVLAVAARHAVWAFQGWALEAASGTTAAFTRMALAVGPVGVAWVAVTAQGARLGGNGTFDWPLLNFVNSTAGPLLTLAAAAATLALALWMRTWRPLRISFHLPNPLGRRRRGSGRGVRFRGGRPELVMLRMMLVQATRQSSFRYTALMLVLLGGLGTILPTGTGVVLVLLSGFIGPVTNFYNLYGADSKAYQLWLGSGRTLGEWTRARQLFTLCHTALFVYGGGLILLLGGTIPAHAAPGLLALPIATGAIGVLAGPMLSRFVLSPHSTEVGFRSRTNSSSRGFFATAAAVSTGIAVLAPGVPIAFTSFWWLDWAAAIVLTAAVFVAGPSSAVWTPQLRTKMASAFR